MKFEAKYQGKWVAAKNDQIIADANSLNKLIQKLRKSEQETHSLKFSLVPRGYIAGQNT